MTMANSPADLRRVALVGLTVLTVLMAVPLLNVVIAGTIATQMGCRLDEAGTYPCIVLGIDIGPLLAVMSVSGWLMLVTLPVLAFLLPVWCIIGIRALWRCR
jgi:hypothetical protein